MRRRGVGLGILGLVLLLVTVVANAHPALTAGTPQAVHVPGPPAVGDCVLDPLVVAIGSGLPATLDVGDMVPPVYPLQQTRPCTGARYGEVVAVLAQPGRAVVRGEVGGAPYVDDPNSDTCALQTSNYLGIGKQSDGWEPALMVTSTLAGPSRLQKAAGQHWAVCIAAPQLLYGFESGPATPSQQRYSATIRDAMHTGRERDHLGNCLGELHETGFGDIVSCSRPHEFEVLAAGDSGPKVIDRDRLEQRCRQVVGTFTGMPDPTAGGALTPRIIVQFGSSTIVTGSQIPADSAVTCGVAPTGTRRLNGSLLALGRQPIPWA